MKTIIRTNYVKNSILFALLLLTTGVFAQEEVEVVEVKSKFSIGGSVDAYYRTNLSATDKAVFGDDGLFLLQPPPLPTRQVLHWEWPI